MEVAACSLMLCWAIINCLSRSIVNIWNDINKYFEMIEEQKMTKVSWEGCKKNLEINVGSWRNSENEFDHSK